MAAPTLTTDSTPQDVWWNATSGQFAIHESFKSFCIFPRLPNHISGYFIKKKILNFNDTVYFY